MSELIFEILEDLKAGHFILVTDDDDRENEADLLMAATFVTKDKINFLINHARGLITNPISKTIADKLKLPLMVPDNEGTFITAFTVSIDAIEGTHTGISSNDKVVTMKKLSDLDSVASDFERPGHVFPLIAHDKGVLVRAGHTEAAIDLLKLAGLTEVGVLCETLNEFGETLKKDDLLEFSKKYKIKIISVAEIKKYVQSVFKTV